MASTSGSHWRLFCQAVDHENQCLGSIFLVHIHPSAYIYSLQEEIFSKLSTRPNAPLDLELWKMSTPLYARTRGSVYKKALGDIKFPDLDLDSDENMDNVQEVKHLHPVGKISQFWDEEPPEDCVHVVVRVPLVNVLGKRSRPVDDLDSVLNSKLVNSTPSIISRTPDYMSLQQIPSEKILDNRPTPDLVPPVSLLYDGFGHFTDTFRRGKLDTLERDLELAVQSFAEKMTDFYRDEADRREEGVYALNEIFSLRGGGYNERLADGNATISVLDDTIVPVPDRPYGYYDGPHGAASCVVVFKNEFIDFTEVPYVELTAYVAQSHAQAIERHREVFNGWRVPCLGLTVLGPYVTFYAIVFLRQWHVVSLTPGLSCVESACDGKDRRRLLVAFFGALALLRQIDEDAARFIRDPPTIGHADRKFPYVSALPRYGTPGKFQFRILRRHPDTQDDRLLYIAETSGKEIIVKFTPRYSIELHSFCAERGHAPRLLGHRQLPGGMFVVAMEYISKSVHPSQSPNLTRLCDKWMGDLRTLVEAFHDHGLVHGDLREPSILCDGENVILMDFDFGGKVGEVYFATAQICDELLDGRDENADPWVTKDDDKRVLEFTLNTLKTKSAHM
ncbi:hypothetical protein F5148DRAFT_75512 [Russula earlei]|uniref:Uncharacterized protein n=1 Tax=Russula earlei TaxID=71964 RepID=A0ACC0U8T0_9AGAM|nr:hypothetical protein F5148DRAFT_75512 [Russula earlei]